MPLDRQPAPSDPWRVVRSVLIVVACASTGAIAVILATLAKHPQLQIDWPDTMSPEIAAGLIVMALTIAALTVWRNRWPVQLSLISSILTILLPLGGMAPTILIFTVLVSDVARRTKVICGLTALLAIFVSIWRDTQLRTHDTSFWRTVLVMRDGQSFPWWLVVALTVVIALVVTGLAILVRNWRRAHVAEEEANTARTQVDELSDRLLRQNEREEVAREVHDALGHRLSLLNLHASALELQAGSNQSLARSARVVQENAQQSAADLRSLLTVLRDPRTPDLLGGVPGLADIPALLQENRAAGTPLTSSLFIDDTADVDPEFGRDCYRIVQELLTNARKHAPGEPLRIHIDVTPHDGADISAVNQLAPTAGTDFVSGNGLVGIRERALRAGGDSAVGIEQNVTTGPDGRAVFRASVHLPWPTETAP